MQQSQIVRPWRLRYPSGHTCQQENLMHSVLVTGGAGFIGQNLVHAWRAARPSDRLVIVDAMTYAASLRSLEPLIASKSIVFVKGDINDAALIRGLFEEHCFTRV